MVPPKFEDFEPTRGRTALQNYQLARHRFVKYCLSKRMTYEDVGVLLGVSKQRIEQMVKYGVRGVPTRTDKASVRARDGKRCRMCGNGARVYLHIHHIGSSKNGTPDNLVTLCAKCHVACEKIRRAQIEAGIRPTLPFDLSTRAA